VKVLQRLRDMHAAGYVHRDIKPGNIMLLPRQNSWTIIDFGCTARTGELAPLTFTLNYSPPEVIKAFLTKEKTIIAKEAIDAWAMGVVAFELVTGTTAFPVLTPRDQVRSNCCPSYWPAMRS
jgi:eukaryotic-like serine/threonine-protein kinase